MAIQKVSPEDTDKKYEVVWREFVTSDQHCVCCPSHFRSGQALIARDREGNLHPIGPTCAANHAFKAQEFIPDFTKVLIIGKSDEHDNRTAEKKISVVSTHPERSAQRTPLTQRQQDVLSVSVLRVRALPAVDIHTAPPFPMQDLVNRWMKQDTIPQALWQRVDSIVTACDAPQNRGKGLATDELMTAYIVQKWLRSVLKSGKLRPTSAATVRDMQEKQAKFRTLTHRAFDYLKALALPTDITPPLFDEKWLRESKPKESPNSKANRLTI